jgi:acyl carrier protein
MEIDIFVKNFEELFEEIKVGSLKPLTKFRDIEEWSSLMALAVIVMVREKYTVRLTGDDIRNSKTIKDLYNIMVTKK